MFSQIENDTNRAGIVDRKLDYSKLKNLVFIKKNQDQSIYLVRFKSENLVDTLIKYSQMSNNNWQGFDKLYDTLESGNFKRLKIRKKSSLNKKFKDCSFWEKTKEWSYLKKASNEKIVVKYK
jgi:hypothetical protein